MTDVSGLACLRNLYRYFVLCLNIYLVDVLFNMHGDEDRLVLSTRLETAYLVAIMYVAPMLVLHAWDLVKAKLDLRGHLRLYLQSSLFRRYLNYSNSALSQHRWHCKAELSCRLACTQMLRRGESLVGTSGRHAARLEFGLKKCRGGLHQVDGSFPEVRAASCLHWCILVHIAEDAAKCYLAWSGWRCSRTSHFGRILEPST